MTREVAYTSLLLSRRRELHRDVAEILEAMFPERRDELAATLGQHWRAARVHERALAFLLIAAGRARETFSNAEARRLYKEALVEAGDDAPARSGIHESLGDLLLLAGEPAAARVHFEAAIADGCGDDLLAARLQRKVGDSWVPTSSADEASAAYERAATTLGPKPAGAAREWWHEWTTLLVARMWLCYWVADEAGMDGFIEEARGALQTLGDRDERLPLLFTLPLFDLRRSRYQPSEQALEWTDDYLAAAEDAGDIGELARATAIHAFTRMWRGELEAARPMYERNLELCRRLGDVTGEIRALVYLGVIHRVWGDVQAVRALAEQALALARAAGLPEYTGSALGHLAWVSCREGDARKARGDGEAAWQDLQQAPGDPFVWLAAWPLLAVRLRDGDVAGGVQLARRLIDSAQMKLPDELEGPLRQAAEAWDDGEENAAGEALSLAVERAEASGRGWL